MPNMMQDTPKMWIDENEDEFQDQFDEIDQNDQALVVQEEKPLLSEQEQTELVKISDISEKNKSMLGELIELNKVSSLLKNLNNEEKIADRNSLLDATCAIFVQSRMQNNTQMEMLKTKLIQRLVDNIDNMDLTLVNEVLSNISQVTSTDANNAMGNLKGGIGGTNSGIPGIQLNINNATAEGAQITTQTLNAGPKQVQELKEVASLNNSLKAWGNLPGKKQPIQAQIIDSSGNN